MPCRDIVDLRLSIILNFAKSPNKWMTVFIRIIGGAGSFVTVTTAVHRGSTDVASPSTEYWVI